MGWWVSPRCTAQGEVGPVISAASRDHIVDCIAKEEAAGGKVLVDGRSWAERRPGTWLGPTVILRTGGAAAAVAAAGKGEEVFGPVLMVVKVTVQRHGNKSLIVASIEF